MSDTRAHKAIVAGLAYLETVVDAEGVLPTRLSLDPLFGESVPMAEASGLLEETFVGKLDYQLADEGYSSAVALLALAGANLPESGSDLPNRLASAVTSCRRGSRFQMFLRGDGYPAETDTTSLAALALFDHGFLAPADLISLGAEVLLATAQDDFGGLRPGAVTLYWPESVEAGRNRQDPVACAHALALLCEARSAGLPGCDRVIDETAAVVTSHLRSGAFQTGTRYYLCPEVFIHAVSRLCSRAPELRPLLAGPLVQAIAHLDADSAPERSWPLNTALLASAADQAGFRAGSDQRKADLLGRQRSDGSWPACLHFRLGRHEAYFGSAAMTTTIAVQALSGGNRDA